MGDQKSEDHRADIRERLTRVEEKLTAHVAQEDEQMEKVVAKLDVISLELSRYRGFVGGILLMVTAVVTFFKLFGAGILEFFDK